jgi:hypothetical protein
MKPRNEEANAPEKGLLNHRGKKFTARILAVETIHYVKLQLGTIQTTLIVG